MLEILIEIEKETEKGIESVIVIEIEIETGIVIGTEIEIEETEILIVIGEEDQTVGIGMVPQGKVINF